MLIINVVCLALQFIDSLTDVVVERKKGQPSNLEIKEAVLLLQGPIVTKRSFKQSAPRRVRGIADVEFEQCLNDLEQQMFGKVAKAHVSRSQNTIVFIKSPPTAECFRNSCLVDMEEYKRKYRMNCHSGISQGLKSYLVEKKIVKEDLLSHSDD